MSHAGQEIYEFYIKIKTERVHKATSRGGLLLQMFLCTRITYKLQYLWISLSMNSTVRNTPKFSEAGPTSPRRLQTLPQTRRPTSSSPISLRTARLQPNLRLCPETAILRFQI